MIYRLVLYMNYLKGFFMFLKMIPKPSNQNSWDPDEDLQGDHIMIPKFADFLLKSSPLLQRIHLIQLPPQTQCVREVAGRSQSHLLLHPVVTQEEITVTCFWVRRFPSIVLKPPIIIHIYN